MALVHALQLEGKAFPITAELLDGIRQTLEAGDNGTYDIDDVLFNLVLTISGLEAGLVDAKSEVAELKADVLNLETRILQAGVRLKPAE